MKIETIIGKVKNHDPILFHERLRRYSILIPLIEINGSPHLLFEVRSMDLRSQPGDICFPGGKIEKTDIDEKYSAIRETTEELGISTKAITNVHPLDIMMPSPERMIYTFVGQIDDQTQIIANESEVAEVFTVPLQYFLHTEPKKYEVTFEATPEKSFPFHLIVGGEDYDWRNGKINQYFYEYEDKVIWGLTAKIILRFLSAIK